VIINQRIRLEDVPITESGPNMCVVLPTIGTNVAHGARLRDRDGVLLDMTDSHYLLEHVSIKLIAGGKESEISVGERRLQPSLVERASRVKEVTEQYRKWFEAGIDGRVFDDEKLARDALVKHLQASRGPLSVFDPYFGRPNKAGSAERDWSLLRGLNRPIRLLTSDEAHPVGASPGINLLEARKWIRKKPPFHDRFYLWDEGGLNVGTSPNGFGGRLFRMQRLGAVEAASLQLRFDAWWSSGDVTTV
jgi:hypothetical protein